LSFAKVSAPSDKTGAPVADGNREPAEIQFREEPHAARLSWWCERYGVAPDTVNKLLPTGHGPEVFTIGRRRFVLRERWHQWLERLSRTGGVHVKDVVPQPGPVQRRDLRGRPRTAAISR